MRRAPALAACAALAAARASACPSCYGAGDNAAVTNGMTYAVVGMLLITGVMLSLVALGAHHFRKRARNLAAGRTADGAPAHSPLTI